MEKEVEEQQPSALQRVVGRLILYAIMLPGNFPGATLLLITWARQRSVKAALFCLAAFVLTQGIISFVLIFMACLKISSASRWAGLVPKTQFDRLNLEDVLPPSAANELFTSFMSDGFQKLLGKLADRKVTAVYVHRYTPSGANRLLDLNAYFTVAGSIVFLNHRPEPGIQTFFLLHELGHVSREASYLLVERVLLLDWLSYLAMVCLLARWNWLTPIVILLAAITQYCVRYNWSFPASSKYALKDERLADQFAFDHLRADDLVSAEAALRHRPFPDPRLTREDNAFRLRTRLKILAGKLRGVEQQPFRTGALSLNARSIIVQLLTAILLAAWGLDLTTGKLILLGVADLVLLALVWLFHQVAEHSRATLVRDLDRGSARGISA